MSSNELPNKPPKPTIILRPNDPRAIMGVFKRGREMIPFSVKMAPAMAYLRKEIGKAILNLGWGCNLVEARFSPNSGGGLKMTLNYTNRQIRDTPGAYYVEAMAADHPEAAYIVNEIINPAAKRVFGEDASFAPNEI